MTDIQNQQLCQISVRRRQLLTETDTEMSERKRRRRSHRGWAPLRNRCPGIHLRHEPDHETESICAQNLDLEIEYPPKTLPWTDKSCQIALMRNTGIVGPSPLDTISCATSFGSKWSASPRPRSCHLTELPILRSLTIRRRGEHGLRLPGRSSQGYPANSQPRRTAEN